MKVIVLAGGEGKRMASSVPKVLVKLGDKPILNHVVDNILPLEPSMIIVVVGRNRQSISEALRIYPNIQLVDQDPPRGTGDAVKQCMAHIQAEDDVLIINGDTPFLNNSVKELCKKETPCILVAKVVNPYGQGRIVLDSDVFHKIVEEKDATEEERKLDLVNTGVYFVKGSHLLKEVPNLSCNNAQNEYYLTDIFKGFNVKLHQIPSELLYEVINVNTPEDLAIANQTIISLK